MHNRMNTNLRDDIEHYSTPLTIISATSVRSSRGTLNTLFVLLRTANIMRHALHSAVGAIFAI